MKEFNFEKLEDVENFLSNIGKDISTKSAAIFLFEKADEYWFDGVKTGRKDRAFNIIKLREIEDNHKYRNFIERVAADKRPDGTYNYCREALEKEAKGLLK